MHRSDVDDRTATATSHVRHCVFSCEIQRLHQDIDPVVPIFLFNRERVAVDSRFGCDHAESVVHEYVQASELLNRFVDHALEVGGGGYVNHGRDRCAARIRYAVYVFFGCVGVNVGDKNCRALFC